MERVLNLAGKNSSEIFQLRYPYSLLSFCDYDLSYFAENAIAVCDEALRSGVLDADRVTDLRNSLKNIHVYVEHHLRTIYDKIVLDCWIDYVCRRDGVGTASLWNRFIDCKTAFEKAVFVRLCEYRYNKGINEWLNLVRVQDYAKSKVYFLFSKELSSVEEACARRNYFDLMFSVTARELGCRLEDLGVTQVFSAGRVPSAPFMYPNISKDIVKNVLVDFDYSDDYSDIASYESLADQIAMDAFSHMKGGLNQELGSYNMSRPTMEHAPSRIFMPCGLKAAVDLEIDALLDSGGWLVRCKRCGRYYVRDSEYTSEYCSLANPGGRTCLEIYEAEHPKSLITPELEKQCDEITDEIYSRVTSGEMALGEYEGWKLYLEAMKEKVRNGEIQPDDLAAFIRYSRTMDISRSNPVVEVRRREPERPQERVVKPFVPERISRSDLAAKQEEPQPEPAELPRPQPRREGFFTSPSVERQKSQGHAPMSHIIRAGEAVRTAEPQMYQRPLDQPVIPERPMRQERPTADFVPYTQQPTVQKPQSAPAQPDFGDFVKSLAESGSNPGKQATKPSEPDFGDFVKSLAESGSNPGKQAAKPSEPDFGDFVKSLAESGSNPGKQAAKPPEPDFGDFVKSLAESGSNPGKQATKPPEPDFGEFVKSLAESGGNPGKQAAKPSEPDFVKSLAESGSDHGKRAAKPPEPVEADFDHFPEAGELTEPQPEWESSRQEPPSPAPRNKVIRKNAAAISAYGRMSAIPGRQEPEFQAISEPEPVAAQAPAAAAPKPEPTQEKQPELPAEDDPFWQIDNIFDMLQKSEQDMSVPEEQPALEKTASRKKPEKAHREPARKRTSAEPKTDESKPVQEAPSGIWTEDRHLYDESDAAAHEELNMLKDKKRGRSSKTQRLFDAIMKEPDDNPNFRKK